MPVNNALKKPTRPIPKPGGSKKRKPNKGKRPIREPRSSVVSYQPKLSPCAELYLKAAVDPFRYNYQALPCVPDTFNALTQRIKVHAFGSGATCTTTGFGFVVATTSGFVTSNLNGGQVTDGSGTVTQIGAATTGISNWQGDSPYSSADFSGVNKQFRVVGAGLRVMYTGSQLNMQGQIQGIVAPSAAAGLNGYATTNSSAIQSVVPQSFANRQWHSVILPIRSSDDTKMQTTPDDSFSTMGLMIFGTAGTSLPFLWEFVSYIEVGGQNVTGAIPSESDPVGFAAATTAISKTYGSHQKNYSWTQVRKEAVKYLHEIGPKVVSTGMKVGAKALMSLI